MNFPEKAALSMLALGIVVSGFTLSGCTSLKNKSPETLSLQDKDSAATIDSREARDILTSPEATMQRDSLERDHLLKF